MGWIEYEPDQYNKGMAKAAWEVAMEEAQKAGMGTFVKAHQIRPRGKSITSGYVLVPVEPTTAMLFKAQEVFEDFLITVPDYELIEAYKAMIQAAQEENLND